MNAITRLREQLEDILWRRTLSDMPGSKRLGLYVVRVSFAVGRDVAEGQLTLRAMSLVYTTLLSLVPLLAISFSVLKGFGVVGYLMRKLDYPLAPAVLAIVLGPLAEASVRQSLIMAHGSFGIFFDRPISATIMAIAIALFVWPLGMAVRRRLRLKEGAGRR